MRRRLGRGAEGTGSLRRWWSVIGVASLASLAPTSALYAQAILVESAPAADASLPAPPRLVLTFNTRIDARQSSVLLVGGPRSTRVLLSTPLGSAVNTLVYPLPVLAPGQYRAEWRALSVDGRRSDGMLRFTVIEVPR